MYYCHLGAEYFCFYNIFLCVHGQKLYLIAMYSLKLEIYHMKYFATEPAPNLQLLKTCEVFLNNPNFTSNHPKAELRYDLNHRIIPRTTSQVWADTSCLQGSGVRVSIRLRLHTPTTSFRLFRLRFWIQQSNLFESFSTPSHDFDSVYVSKMIFCMKITLRSVLRALDMYKISLRIKNVLKLRNEHMKQDEMF